MGMTLSSLQARCLLLGSKVVPDETILATRGRNCDDYSSSSASLKAQLDNDANVVPKIHSYIPV